MGNEKADELAKHATDLVHNVTIPQSTSITSQYLKTKMYEVWDEQWQKETTCRQTKQFFPNPDPLRSKKLLKLARSQLTTVIKITTGHNMLSYHASKIDPTIDSTCGLCGEEDETFYHFVTDCLRLRLTRIDCNLEVFDRKTWVAESLLDLARVPAIEALLTRF